MSISSLVQSQPARRPPVGDRIPAPQKLTFAAGVNMDYFANGLLTAVLWMPYFNIGLGMSPVVLGFILMALRAWEAMTDPLIGNLSDNARTRWGRRKPFIAVGAVLCAVIYPVFWYMPAELGEMGKAVYLTVAGMFFYLSYTLWAMPYYGLQMELTPDYDERTRLTAWMTFFGKLSIFAGGWVLAAATGSWFADPTTGKPDIVAGMKVCGWVIAAAILVFGLLPALFVKERYYEVEVAQQTRDPFWKSIRESIACRPLWPLIGISFFLILGNGSVASLGQYLNIYYVFHGDLAPASIITGWKTTIVVVTGIASIPMWTWLGEKFDKKPVVTVMLGGAIFGHLLHYNLLTPDYPWLQLIPAVFESGAVAAIWLFIPSMKADVADIDELHTSRRREGALNAFYAWFNKVAYVVAMGLSGVILDLSGFSVKWALQSPEVLHRMMWWFLILPVVSWGLALFFIARYPLGRVRMASVRGELESRRGQI